jgi:hypothetical protein
MRDDADVKSVSDFGGHRQKAKSKKFETEAFFPGWTDFLTHRARRSIHTHD